MLVKTQHNLQPRETPAHSVIIEDDMGNPIFVAVQMTEAITCANVGDPNFQTVLQMLGVNKTVTVTEFKPKPMQNIIWTP